MEESSSLEQITTTHSSKSQGSPSPTPSSPDTTITEPEQSPGADDDVWDTSSDHFPPAHENGDSTSQSHDLDSHPQFMRGDMLSDLPAIRRQHMTDGYREGLSVGKARVMQSGFDAGYPVGVEVGLRVGNVLGVLEGIIAALTSSRGKGRALRSRGATSSNAVDDAELGIGSASQGSMEGAKGSAQGEEDLKFARIIYARAQEELKISELLKRLDDEKIAAISDAASPIDDDGGTKEATAKKQPLPDEVEDVLGKWERLVLGDLRQVPSEDKPHVAMTKEMAVEVCMQ